MEVFYMNTKAKTTDEINIDDLTIDDIKTIDVSEKLGFDPNNYEEIYIETVDYFKHRLCRKRAKEIENYINNRLGFGEKSNYKIECIFKAKLSVEDDCFDEEDEVINETNPYQNNFLDVLYYFELMFVDAEQKGHTIYTKNIILISDVTNEKAFTEFTKQLLKKFLPIEKQYSGLF